MNKRILVIEDEENVRELIKECFSEEFECATAENGQKGLKILESFEPDLIILDVKLPDINGFELINEIRNKNPYVSIIFLSGVYVNTRSIVNGLNLGADDYIVKPFYTEELILRVKRKLERSDF